MSIEIERKFDAPADFVLPAADVLAAALGKRATGREDGTVQLTATYYDTADFRLARSKVTLRRRTGGKDAGWHLKLPGSADEREEVTAPLGRAGVVPAALRPLVTALVRGEKLAPVATLRTTRRVVTLIDGAPAIEVVEDEVTATRTATPDDSETWREIEAEILEGDRDQLENVSAALFAAGAAEVKSASKLARALGDIGPMLLPVPAEAKEKDVRKQSVSTVLAGLLATHVTSLVTQDRRVRRELPDSVHKMRVAARRLRATLRTFGPVLDSTKTDPIAAELRWLGEGLGAARDREVQLERVQELLVNLPDQLVIGPVEERLTAQLGGDLRIALKTSIDALGSPRYLALLDALYELADQPPVTRDGKASKELPGLARHAWSRLEKRAETALHEGEAVPDEDLHEIRKAAKQARYAGEAMVPAYGPAAAEFAAAVETVQEVLGEHQDAVVLLPVLRELGAHPEVGFTFGVLYEQEASRGAQRRAQWPDAWAAARKKELRHWMRAPSK
jgi:CHAD domain-containing protein